MFPAPASSAALSGKRNRELGVSDAGVVTGTTQTALQRPPMDTLTDRMSVVNKIRQVRQRSTEMRTGKCFVRMET